MNYLYAFLRHASVLIITLIVIPTQATEKAIDYYEEFKSLSITQSPKSGVYVLENGEDALITRAWLADQARESIEVQYFIWSTDNIGILATEALLRAANRGVKVRVIVDDLLIDAPDKSLLALEKHPNIHIKIYNPKHKVGTPLHARVINLLTNFRGFNQRMHDKTFVVDGFVAITGGRNMADEYYDYDHKYNFRDRDVLLVGNASHKIQASFNRFWNHKISFAIEDLYDGFGIMQKNIDVNHQEIEEIYQDLHKYAQSEENFKPEIRALISDISQTIPRLMDKLKWVDVNIISDDPGKNNAKFSLGGGGKSTIALANLLKSAKKEVVIQSPYVILTKEAKALFASLIEKGIKISISTNSMESTDNIQAFSGYKNQRNELLKMGINIFEYKAFPQTQKTIMQRYKQLNDKHPIFALHAKTLVIDAKQVFIGTFNLDPRSINLNTEIGAVIHDESIATQVRKAIIVDMSDENSWDPREKNPDRHSSLLKRLKVLFWRLTPIKPLL